MQKNIVFNDFKNPEDVQQLKNYLKEIYDQMDDLFLTSSPNSTVSARRGRGALVFTGGQYYRYVNIDGAKAWRGVLLNQT